MSARSSPPSACPTFVFHRSGDRTISVGAGRYLAEHIPGATFVELPGDDHLPWIGDSDAVVGEIEQFLTGVRPTGERSGPGDGPVHRHRRLHRKGLDARGRDLEGDRLRP